MLGIYQADYMCVVCLGYNKKTTSVRYASVILQTDYMYVVCLCDTQTDYMGVVCLCDISNILYGCGMFV